MLVHELEVGHKASQKTAEQSRGVRVDRFNVSDLTEVSHDDHCVPIDRDGIISECFSKVGDGCLCWLEASEGDVKTQDENAHASIDFRLDTVCPHHTRRGGLLHSFGTPII
jgi:hypothetical protein